MKKAAPRIISAVTAAVLAASLTACGKHEIPINTRPVTRTSPDTEAVDACTELESMTDSTADSAAETTAVTEKEKKKKKTKKTEAETTEETTTTTAEPEVPDIRREQPYLGAADYDDFSDACFIGASQTVGLSLFGGKTAPDFFAFAGLNVKTVFTTEFLNPDGSTARVNSMADSDEEEDDDEKDSGMCTVLDVVGNKSYGRIYLLFGINEMGGWIDYNQFYDGYVQLIRELKQLQPNAIIYVQSVLPVSKYALETNSKFTNENIDSFNINYVRPIANDTGSVYVNINPMFKCENGALAKDASSDGIHMNASYCLEWMDMLAYYAPAGGPVRPMPEDYSPQPVTPTTQPNSPDDGDLPPEVIPPTLPDVVIPDTPPETTAPADDTDDNNY